MVQGIGVAMSDRYSEEAIQVLSLVPYFKGLDQRTLGAIARDSIRREYEPGQLVILEGEPASGLYIVQEGWLKVSKISIDGREQILQFLGSGDVFNAVSVFTGTANPASVTALEATRLWLIGRDTMLRLLDSHSGLARLVIQDLAGRVTHLISLVEDLSLRTVEARLARLLLEQSIKDKVRRKKWATQTEMASRLGTVPDVISRTLRKLSERGLIEIARHEIRILDRPELESIAMVEG
jgi:CRP/FNR family transcriptional regulator, dissimilatory nitrate respiration regulator